MLKFKLKEWARRYAPLEVVATITALLAAYATNSFTGDSVAVALAGTWGENFGYYSYAGVREMRAQSQAAANTGRSFLMRFRQALGNLLFEFGAAEFVDSFVSRPLLMYFGTVLLGHLGAGIVAGKIAADLIFYAIAILFYELGKPRGQ